MDFSLAALCFTNYTTKRHILIGFFQDFLFFVIALILRRIHRAPFDKLLLYCVRERMSFCLHLGALKDEVTKGSKTQKERHDICRAFLFGGDGEIRTLAPLSRPTAFRVRTLQPLGYISKMFLKKCKILHFMVFIASFHIVQTAASISTQVPTLQTNGWLYTITRSVNIIMTHFFSGCKSR